jgi:hypothetical protein
MKPNIQSMYASSLDVTVRLSSITGGIGYLQETRTGGFWDASPPMSDTEQLFCSLVETKGSVLENLTYMEYEDYSHVLL